MQTEQIVAMLVSERDRLTRAIEALQGPTKRRGRPRKNSGVTVAGDTAMVATAPTVGPKKRAPRTAAQKKEQAKRMKAYWKKRKAAEAES
jgi:hypothetical protein